MSTCLGFVPGTTTQPHGCCTVNCLHYKVWKFCEHISITQKCPGRQDEIGTLILHFKGKDNKLNSFFLFFFLVCLFLDFYLLRWGFLASALSLAANTWSCSRRVTGADVWPCYDPGNKTDVAVPHQEGAGARTAQPLPSALMRPGTQTCWMFDG